jgi:hypothetical protein
MGPCVGVESRDAECSEIKAHQSFGAVRKMGYRGLAMELNSEVFGRRELWRRGGG